MATYKGIDVSEHNGVIDWAKVKDNVDFAILRIGWVGNKQNHTLDKKFKANYEACKKHGIKIGAYVYMYSDSEAHAKEGAEWAIKQIKGLQFDLPIYCDMEDKSIAGLGKTKLTSIVKAFNNVIEANGFWAGIYANKNWYDNYLEDGIEKRYTSWIAHYTSGTNKYQGEFDMWQNSSKGSIDGISGNVDTNYLYRDLFSAIKDKKATSNAPKPAKTPTNTSSNTNKSYAKGQQIKLSNKPLYANATTKTAAKRLTGTYYIYDGLKISGRYRITNSKSNCGKTPIGKYVTGWIELNL